MLGATDPPTPRPPSPLASVATRHEQPELVVSTVGLVGAIGCLLGMAARGDLDWEQALGLLPACYVVFWLMLVDARVPHRERIECWVMTALSAITVLAGQMSGAAIAGVALAVLMGQGEHTLAALLRGMTATAIWVIACLVVVETLQIPIEMPLVENHPLMLAGTTTSLLGLVVVEYLWSPLTSSEEGMPWPLALRCGGWLALGQSLLWLAASFD